MPSENQQGETTEASSIERKAMSWPAEKLLAIKPMTEASAREWLGACNKYERSVEVKEHFAACVRRSKDDE